MTRLLLCTLFLTVPILGLHSNNPILLEEDDKEFVTTIKPETTTTPTKPPTTATAPTTTHTTTTSTTTTTPFFTTKSTTYPFVTTTKGTTTPRPQRQVCSKRFYSSICAIPSFQVPSILGQLGRLWLLPLCRLCSPNDLV